MPDHTPTPTVTPTAVDVSALAARIDRVEARSQDTAPATPWRSLGEWWRATRDGDPAATRAWTDQISGNNPGVMTPTYLTEVVGILAQTRPLIQALGTQAVTSGMSVTWPYYDGASGPLVGIQATEKTVITSARADIKSATKSLTTFAGGGDLSIQLIEHSDPSYLDAFLRIAFAEYATLTDAAFAASLVTSAGTAITYTKGAPAAFLDAFLTASISVASETGAPPAAVVCGRTIFAKIVGARDTTGRALYPALGPVNSEGTAGPAGLSGTILGVPIILDGGVDPDTAIVTNSTAAKWGEDGPRTMTADVPSKLGRDVAIYGYGAPLVYIPAGVKVIKEAP